MFTNVYTYTHTHTHTQKNGEKTDIKTVAAGGHPRPQILSSSGTSVIQEKIKTFYIHKPQYLRPVA